jgi:prophage antirepressor-like protein
MMEKLKVFSNPQFGEIRTIIENSEPHFSAADVCRALGYANPRKSISDHVDSRDVTKRDTLTNGGVQQLTYISESGMYALIFGSKLETAREFKYWVTSEVLPSIRKHGAYATEQTIENMLANPENAIKIFTALKEERTKREIAEKAIEVQEAQLKELAPKAQYTDKVLQSTETYATTRIAQELGMSAITLNKKLHERRIQRKVDGQWVLYAQYLNEGFTKPHTVPFLKPDGTTGTNTQTVWTEKGRKFIHEIFNSIPK